MTTAPYCTMIRVISSSSNELKSSSITRPAFGAIPANWFVVNPPLAFVTDPGILITLVDQPPFPRTLPATCDPCPSRSSRSPLESEIGPVRAS